MKRVLVILLTFLLVSCTSINWNKETGFKYNRVLSKFSGTCHYKNPETGEELDVEVSSDPSPAVELAKWAFQIGKESALKEVGQ